MEKKGKEVEQKRYKEMNDLIMKEKKEKKEKKGIKGKGRKKRKR